MSELDLTRTSRRRATMHFHCDTCHGRILPGEMYDHYHGVLIFDDDVVPVDSRQCMTCIAGYEYVQSRLAKVPDRFGTLIEVWDGPGDHAPDPRSQRI